jgi:hypothetical protein
MRNKPIGEVIVELGLSFVGTPYVAHTLEVSGDERLVVNLSAFDCTTFMENMLVLARCIKRGTTSFTGFKHELQFVRYRGGVIDGYPSRLHYFTDWLDNNCEKGVLRDIGKDLGGEKVRRGINFMTTHTSAYRQLASPRFVERVKTAEERLSEVERYYVPKEKVPSAESALQSGDIVGITTSMEGLDVSHTGLVIRQEETVKFLHAPLSGGAVEVSKHSFAEYLAERETQTGIVVGRPLEPGT